MLHFRQSRDTHKRGSFFMLAPKSIRWELPILSPSGGKMYWTTSANIFVSPFRDFSLLYCTCRHKKALNKPLNGGCSGDPPRRGHPLDCVRIEDKFPLLPGIGSRGKASFKDDQRMETGEHRLLLPCLLGYFYRFCEDYCLGRGGFH